MTISLAVPDILVARAQSGDLEALEALYRAFETPVYNLALRVLRRPEDAEDVLQETFLEVVRSLKQYRGEGHLWGWIRQIATSKALMRIRHDRVRETEEFHEESAVGAGAGAGAGDVDGVGAMGGAGGMSLGAVPAQIDLEQAVERRGEAGAAAGAGALARGAGRRSGRAAPAPRAVGRLGPRRGGGARRAPRVPAVLDEAGRRRRARPREAAIGDAGAAAGALRSRRTGD